MCWRNRFPPEMLSESGLDADRQAPRNPEKIGLLAGTMIFRRRSGWKVE